MCTHIYVHIYSIFKSIEILAQQLKVLSCSFRGLRFNPKHPYSSSQPFAIAVLGLRTLFRHLVAAVVP